MTQCSDELHVDDVGTNLLYRVFECLEDGTKAIVDITTATSLIIRYRKSDVAKTTYDKAGSIYTGGDNGDGTDGIIRYVVEEGFVDIKGSWKEQAIISFPGGSVFHSSIHDKIVVANLAPPLVVIP